MIIRDLGKVVEPNGRKQHRVIVECAVCKKHRETRANRVKDKDTICRSCQIIKRSTTHGLYYHPLKGVYNTMKQRCTNSNHIMYYRYGKRGITVCKEWSNDFKVFFDWALENGYKKGLSIDRIDNDGNYEPNNCRWITLAENISRNAKLSKQQKEDICKIYKESSLTQTSISKMFNVDKSLIGMILKENGIKTEYRKNNYATTEKQRQVRLENLKKWRESKEGKMKMSESGKRKRKLSKEQVLEISQKLKDGRSSYSLGKEYSISKSSILKISHRKTYKEFLNE